jgi:glycine C-acetyltransferase
MNAFLSDERKNGSLIGRIGFPPVDSRQRYKDPVNDQWYDVIVLGSNSYLGLSNESGIKEEVIEAIREFGLGSGGSPAFSGYMSQQVDLEMELATLSGHESAILLNGGYLANLAWISSLIDKNDVLIYDKNSHASVLDAIKLAGIKHAFSLDTDNHQMLSSILHKTKLDYPDSQIFLTIEGVRSIDGSVVELKCILDTVRNFDENIFVMLDDAHGLGTLGHRGYGAMEFLNLMGEVDLRMSTCSKAFGMQGAFLTGGSKVINYIRLMANSYNFTTAMSQPVLAGIKAALKFLKQNPSRIAKLHENKVYLQNGLENMGFNIYRAPSGIIPIFIPGAPCDKINRSLFEQGLFVNVMAYPMIAPGQERIRLSAMAVSSKQDMDQALEILERTGKEYGIL